VLKVIVTVPETSLSVPLGCGLSERVGELQWAGSCKENGPTDNSAYAQRTHFTPTIKALTRDCNDHFVCYLLTATN